MLGTVIQDVVADAMSTEVVSRVDAAGKPVPEENVRAELGMVQVLGRLSLSAGILAVAGLSGWVAGLMSRESVFLLGLVIPALSDRRRLPDQIRNRGAARRSTGASSAADLLSARSSSCSALGGVPFAQEIIFAISMGVICTMLFFVTRDLAPATTRAILFTTIIIFAFRATPSVGDGYFWWTLDVLKFDAEFYGVLRQTGALLALVGMWLFAKQLTEYSAAKTLLWITIVGTLLSLPSVGLFYGLHEWTERMFGFGARSIAFIDTAAASPFAQLSHDPAADADRLLCPGRPPRDLVRADGVADEHGSGRRAAADQIS